MPTTSPSDPRAFLAPPMRPQRTDEPTPARPAPTAGHRAMSSPRSATTIGRAGMPPRRRLRWRPRRTRGWARAVSLVVLLGATLALSAAVASDTASASAQPPSCTPGSPLPDCHLPDPSIPPPTSVTCVPESLQPECQNPSNAAVVGPPCPGKDCLPQPPTSALPPTGPGAGPSGEGGAGELNCGITTIGDCVTNAITGFFRGMVTAALNPTSRSRNSRVDSHGGRAAPRKGACICCNPLRSSLPPPRATPPQYASAGYLPRASLSPAARPGHCA